MFIEKHFIEITKYYNRQDDKLVYVNNNISVAFCCTVDGNLAYDEMLKWNVSLTTKILSTTF